MSVVCTTALRRLALRPSIPLCSRYCSSAAAQKLGPEAHKETGEPKAENSDGQRARHTPRTAREFDQPITGGRKLTKVQKRGLGGAGAMVAAAGAGGLAFLNWPLMGPSGVCMTACVGGVALLSLAVKGEIPAGKEKHSPVAKRILELKLVNESVRLKGELDALQKLGAQQQWPQEVQAALVKADTQALEEKKSAAKQRANELLEDVKGDLASGVTSAAVRQRLRPRLFIFDFRPSGEGLAAARPGAVTSQLEMLSASVNLILSAASKHDQAVLRLTSPGGSVPPYGLAAAQLQRLRDAGVHLTVCVDTVAASGGYLMACLANHIVAAPFSMIGSIGVIAGSPNIHKLLERNEIEFTQVTAGKYKRSVNVLTPNTPEGLAKFKDDVEVIHTAFQEHVKHWRPDVEIDQVATGEVWLGGAAKKKGLVDEVGTSDGYIRQKVEDGFDAVELARPEKKKQGFAKLLDGLGGEKAAETLVDRFGDLASAAWARLRGEATPPRMEAPHLYDVQR